jgi:hypothetical protein
MRGKDPPSHLLPLPHQEETRLAMVSVPESNLKKKKYKHKVMHLFNGNFGDFCETFLRGQLQQ